MESEQYFKCPVCGKKVLKRKGQMLMWTRICKECYQKMQNHCEELKSKGWK